MASTDNRQEYAVWPCPECGDNPTRGHHPDCERGRNPDWRRDLQAAVDRVNQREDQRRRRARDGRRAIATFGLACLIAGMLILADQARAGIPPAVFKAVRAEWPRRADRITAFRIIHCETGGTYSTTIGGTRYGLFQFGPWERSRFGYGHTARAQAHGAHNYWLRSGWAPWLNYEPPGCGR